MVEFALGKDDHKNKVPGQIFKKAVNAQETITAPLKRRMGIHMINLSKKQKWKLKAKLDENAILPKQYSQLNLHHIYHLHYRLTFYHKGTFVQNTYRYNKKETKFINDTVVQLLKDENIQPSTRL